LTHNSFFNGIATGLSQFAGTTEGGDAFQDEENIKVEYLMNLKAI
jgi:hypothetical protein